MNALLTDPTALALALLGVLMGVFTWFGRRELARFDKALNEMVRKDELEKLRDDMDRRHQENLDRLDRIDTATTGTHQRIDQLYRDLIGNGKNGKNA